ncbi:MAG: OadG family protein [Hyphomicrobiales bacterium]|nr:OadG family protein [Hyphomicrobiales bacterium]
MLLIATGFGVVMGVLTALWGMCALVGAVFRVFEKAVDAKSEHTEATEAGPDQIPPAHLAAIAAAIASLSTPYRVVRISAPPHIASAWGMQGRLAQQAKYSRSAWSASGRAGRSTNRDNEGREP